MTAKLLGQQSRWVNWLFAGLILLALALLMYSAFTGPEVNTIRTEPNPAMGSSDEPTVPFPRRGVSHHAPRPLRVSFRQERLCLVASSMGAHPRLTETN